MLDCLCLANEAESICQWAEQGKNQWKITSQPGAKLANTQKLLLKARCIESQAWKRAPLSSLCDSRLWLRIGHIRHDFHDIDVEFLTEELHRHFCQPLT